MVAAQAVVTEPLLLSARQRQADCPAEKCSLSVPPARCHLRCAIAPELVLRHSSGQGIAENVMSAAKTRQKSAVYQGVHEHFLTKYLQAE
jgi:hypothetical protein